MYSIKFERQHEEASLEKIRACHLCAGAIALFTGNLELLDVGAHSRFDSESIVVEGVVVKPVDIDV